MSEERREVRQRERGRRRVTRRDEILTCYGGCRHVVNRTQGFDAHIV